MQTECSANELRRTILESFPSYPFRGPVMAVSHAPSVYEVETDNLDSVLGGKEWRELSADFVDTNQDEYVLMNSSAVVAFLGAWLWWAVDRLTETNSIRSSLIFHLATYGAARNSGLWARGFKSLNQQQRNVIASLLRCAHLASTSDKEKEQITLALKSVEENPFVEA